VLVNPAGTGINQIAAPRMTGKIARHWIVIFSTQPSRQSSLPLKWSGGITMAHSEVRFTRCAAM
jgi:hypothetical protein